QPALSIRPPQPARRQHVQRPAPNPTRGLNRDRQPKPDIAGAQQDRTTRRRIRNRTQRVRCGSHRTIEFMKSLTMPATGEREVVAPPFAPAFLLFRAASSLFDLLPFLGHAQLVEQLFDLLLDVAGLIDHQRFPLREVFYGPTLWVV